MARQATAATGAPWRPVRLALAVWAGGCLLVACSAGPRRKATTTTTAPHTTVVATATTTTTPSAFAYRVRSGDTLSAIAKRFGVSVAAIVAANHIADPNSIKVGQALTIPAPPPATTTTATSAPAPAKLAISPGDGQAGTVFSLNLTGAPPAETVMFEIDAPDGSKFHGPPHTVLPNGTVSTEYVTSASDKPGTYAVVATGNQGTSVQASFRVDPATG